ncbi:hypothetical protein MC885_020494 [Smutsia gigantea]|nr:hypothetical protein MC885_020494 [Smutsia gigantea]
MRGRVLCPIPKCLPRLHTLCACFLYTGLRQTSAAQDGDLAGGETEPPSMPCSRSGSADV